MPSRTKSRMVRRDIQRLKVVAGEREHPRQEPPNESPPGERDFLIFASVATATKLATCDAMGGALEVEQVEERT